MRKQTGEEPKNKGFSLPSVMIGSIIAAVLGTVATSSMWESVGQAKVAAEKASVAEMKVAMAGFLEENNGFPSVLSDAQDEILKEKLASIANPDIKYEVILGYNRTATQSDDALYLRATPANDDVVGSFKQIAAELSIHLDGNNVTNEGSSCSEGTGLQSYSMGVTCPAYPTRGAKLAFKNTCNEEKYEADCFYLMPLVYKGVPPEQLPESLFWSAEGTNAAWSNSIYAPYGANGGSDVIADSNITVLN